MVKELSNQPTGLQVRQRVVHHAAFGSEQDHDDPAHYIQ
jgi:hypothetical protein